jgi:hypothetical protein
MTPANIVKAGTVDDGVNLFSEWLRGNRQSSLGEINAATPETQDVELSG